VHRMDGGSSGSSCGGSGGGRHGRFALDSWDDQGGECASLLLSGACRCLLVRVGSGPGKAPHGSWLF